MEIVAILIAGLTLPVEMVARQLVREQLVRRLIEMKSPYALDVSCWEIGGVGYTQAVKTKYILGAGVCRTFEGGTCEAASSCSTDMRRDPLAKHVGTGILCGRIATRPAFPCIDCCRSLSHQRI
jgi:hypothetical protein